MASIGHFEKIRALASSGRRLALGGARAGAASTVTVFDLTANKTLFSLETPAHVHGVALNKELLLAAGSDGVVRSWAPKTGAPGIAIEAHAGACSAVAIAPDGERLASVGVDGALRLWSTDGGQKVGEWALSAAALRAVAFDPSGEYVAAAGDDGVVRSVTLATGQTREMPGHKGPVYALAFTPRDGRLASAGDDGSIKLWYLVGAVEFESRGGDGASDGHEGAVLALCFPPTPSPPEGGGESPGDRLFSGGADGKIKVWQLDNRRKPRTLDCGKPAVHALAFAAPSGPEAAKSSIGSVLAGGDRRTVFRFTLDLQGATTDEAATTTRYEHGFDALESDLSEKRPAREAAIKRLAALDEEEALELLYKPLAGDKEPEVRALVATELARHQRAGARLKVRERLNDDIAKVRDAAFAALKILITPLGAARAAIESRDADTRIAALRELVLLRDTSPLVPGLVAGRLADGNASARMAALDAVTALHEAGSPEPLRIGYERGPADLKIEALIRASLGGLVSHGSIAPLVSRGLDDESDDVRRIAFAVKVLERRPLARLLEGRDAAFTRTAAEIARRIAHLTRAKPDAKQPSDEEVKAARGRIPGVGEAGSQIQERDLEPLLAAMACRTADTALRGARGLAELGDTRALGALLQLSRETSPHLRAHAAAALQALDDTRAARRLVWMLDDSDAGVRAAAADAYARLAAKEPLVIAEASLRSAHEDIRVRGLDRLVKLGQGGPHGARAETLLGDALEDEAAKVRSEAFRTLWSWHDKEPRKALDRALAARFPDLRLRAVEELASLGKKEAWAVQQLQKTIGDRDAGVAMAAYTLVVKQVGKEVADPHLAAMATVHATVRAAGAKGSEKLVPEGAAARRGWSVPDAVRTALMTLLQDEIAPVRIAAVEALDLLLPAESGPLHAALHQSRLDLKVRAAELLAARRDEELIEAMRWLLTDKDLFKQHPIDFLRPLRERGAMALATLGSNRTVRFFATELVKDDYPEVREQAARGLCNACKKGPPDEGYLLDALSSADIAVRSWAAEGLARLGDARALPVLTGTLRHDHLPIRVGAIRSFAALGPEGYGGMLQGLEDPDRDVQEDFFAIVLARDLRTFRRGAAPDLLTSALSSQRAEIRFTAARAIELRTDPDAYLANLIEVLTPPRPEKAGDMKDWPTEEVRGRLLVGLAEALAADTPAERYAAGQALILRRKPLDYFREVQRVVKPRSADAAIVPDTTPRGPAESDTKAKKGWLRSLFSRKGDEGKPGSSSSSSEAPVKVADDEQTRLRWLAFGAYVGLLRQSAAGDDQANQVRRDAIDRIVALCLEQQVSSTAAIPPLLRALDDPHHLVRKAAFAGLRKLFPDDPDEPLSLALAGAAADVARAALDELMARGESARPRIAAALNSRLADVRKYAFELLERLSPKGSLDPLLAAIGCEHADLRLGVVERLAASGDPRVAQALVRAMESDHDDLRLRAAELLSQRKDDRAVGVLAAFLRSDDRNLAGRAIDALVKLGTELAVRGLVARLEEQPADAERATLVEALGRTRHPAALDAISGRFDDERTDVRTAAFAAALAVAGEQRKRRDHSLALRFLKAAARAKDPAIRLAAAGELDAVDLSDASGLLVGLFNDRDKDTRVAAVTRYSLRVMAREGAYSHEPLTLTKPVPVAPLDEVLRAGTRELMLPAAEGVAARRLPSALRPLLLFVRAGEEGERERALLALGTLGDVRALEEIETIAGGGTEEAPAEPSMQAAAIEALGRLAGQKFPDREAWQRVWDRIEQNSIDGAGDNRAAAIRALRWIAASGDERSRGRIEAIVADTRDDDDQRVLSCEQLGLLGDVAVEPTLGRALNDGDQRVRMAARKALEKLFPADRPRVEFLCAASRHSDIAGPAAAFLADEGDAGALLERLGGQLDEDLRRRLRYGLVRRPALPLDSLARLLTSDEPLARDDGAWITGAITGNRGEAALLGEADRASLSTALVAAERVTAQRWGSARDETAREREERAWARILWAAGQVAPAAIAVAARQAVQGGDRAAPASVRREATRALGAARGDAPALTAALGDIEGAVRAAAASALGRVDPRGAADVALQVQPFDAVTLGRTVDGDGARLAATSPGRRLALPSLLAAGDATPLCDLARKATDEATRLDAFAALGRVGGAEAIALLSSLAFDKKYGDANLRKAAYRALRRAQRRTPNPSPSPTDGDEADE